MNRTLTTLISFMLMVWLFGCGGNNSTVSNQSVDNHQTSSVSSTAMYLHGSGGTNNPPNLYLDSTAPTGSQTKYKDSTGVHFSGGNPWVEVGVWTADANVIEHQLTDLSPLHVWAGLKNSDDVGTHFDVRAEVWQSYSGGTLVGAGEVYDIDNLVRNASLAREITVSFADIIQTNFNGTTDILSLRVLTRIGTDGNGNFAGGHSNATGLRVYFDSTTRMAEFGVTTESPQQGDWSMFGHDPQHTHRSPFVGPETNSLKWKFKSFGPGFDYTKANFGPDGAIYVGSGSELVVYEEDGTKRWFYVGYGKLCAAPAVDNNGDAYFCSYIEQINHGVVTAVDAEGQLRWEYDSPNSTYFPGSSPAIGADGTVYVRRAEVPTWDIYLEAISPNGILQWSQPIGQCGSLASAPAIDADGNIIVLHCSNNSLCCFSPDGDLIWSCNLDDTNPPRPTWSPTIGQNGNIYLSADSTVQAVDHDGNFLWEWLAETGGIFSTPLPYANGVYVVDNEGKVNFLSASDGSVIWTCPLGTPLWEMTDPGIAQDGTVYYSCGSYEDPYVFSLNAVGPDGSLLWSQPIESRAVASLSVDANGTLYFPNTAHYLSAINPDGSIKWSVANGGGISSSSPVSRSDGSVCIGGGSYLYMINPDGSLGWYFEDPLEQGQAFTSPAIGPDGTVYVGNTLGHCYAISPNGTLEWDFEAGGMVASPTLDPDGTIYFGSSDRYLYALDPSGTLQWSYEVPYYGIELTSPSLAMDGSVVATCPSYVFSTSHNGVGQWSYQFPSWGAQGFRATPAIGSDGAIFVSSEFGKFYAFETDGTVRWSYPSNVPETVILSSPALATDGTIYYGDALGTLTALNPDGTLKWTFESLGPLKSSPCIDANGVIYFGSSDGHLYAVNPDGTEKWNYQCYSSVWCSPSIGQDGTILIADMSGHLYAIGPGGS